MSTMTQAWYFCRTSGRPHYCAGVFKTLGGAVHFETSIKPKGVPKKMADQFVNYFTQSGYKTGVAAKKPSNRKASTKH